MRLACGILTVLLGLVLGACSLGGSKVDMATLLMGAKLQGKLEANLGPLCPPLSPAPKLPGTACADLGIGSKAFDALVLAASSSGGLDETRAREFLQLLLGGGLAGSGLIPAGLSGLVK